MAPKLAFVLALTFSGWQTANAAREMHATPYRVSSVHYDTRGVISHLVDCKNYSTVPQTVTLSVGPNSYMTTGPGGNYVRVPFSASNTFTIDPLKSVNARVTAFCSAAKKCEFNIFGKKVNQGGAPKVGSARIDMSSLIEFIIEVEEDRGAVGCSVYGYSFGSGGTHNYLITPSRLDVNGGRPF